MISSFGRSSSLLLVVVLRAGSALLLLACRFDVLFGGPCRENRIEQAKGEHVVDALWAGGLSHDTGKGGEKIQIQKLQYYDTM